VLIAQITDTHVRRKRDLLHHMIRTGRELRRCVEALNARVPQPDFVVATGDLVDRGKVKEYRRLRAILDELRAPLYVLPGNHDDVGELRATFHDHAYLPRTGPLCYAVETRPVRLIGLDTTRGRKPGGELDARRLMWFERTLAEQPAVPTLVAMHHPPFDLGIAPVDAKPLRGREAFEAIVARHPQIARIVCGHVHCAVERPFGGTLASTAPSTSVQLAFDAGDDGTYGLHVEAPGYALHRFTGERIVTSIERTAQARRLRAVS
jgi:3',5'-cyclic AMP phosphodiesterase CpdA